MFYETGSEILDRIHGLLLDALGLCNGSKAKLGRSIGVRASTVCSWYRGSYPSPRHILTLEIFVRTFDGHSDDEYQPVKVHGAAAGSEVLTSESEVK